MQVAFDRRLSYISSFIVADVGVRFSVEQS